MKNNNFLKIILITVITVCTVCLLVKSFMAIHYMPELDGGGMSLVFKANPLGDNLIFEDRDEARYFLTTHPEAYAGNSLFDYIFKIPLPVYVFIILLLVSVWIKKKNPMLKRKQLMIPTKAIPLFIWIIWLFQSYEPTEKTYSIDNQYSYYFELYNFNRVKPISVFYTLDFGFAGVRGSYYYYKRKIILYDEVKQCVLATEYFGDKSDIEFFVEKHGFDYWVDSREFWMNKRKYRLPRPIDKQAIEQMKNKERAIVRENELSDSLCWVQIKEEFSNLPAITQEELEEIQPVIKKWTDHYKIDVSHAKFLRHSNTDFNNKPTKENGFYREFTAKEDSPSLPGMSYSPDKQRYIDISVDIETTKGTHYYAGQNLSCNYLVDRKEKHQNHLFGDDSYSSIERLHDVFWINNDVFIVVGVNYSYKLLDVPCIKNLKLTRISFTAYAIYVFDINNSTIKEYGLLGEDPNWSIEDSYFKEYLKERGIMRKNEH